jgi:Amt family ammonium transporter
VWGGGWLGKLGALDFAGGTVVHVNAAAAALVLRVVVGSRKDLRATGDAAAERPVHAARRGTAVARLVRLQRGSALGANALAALAFVNTMLAPIGDARRLDAARSDANAKATAIGAATGIVVGLVAITPRAGFVSPLSAILLGGIAAVPSLLRAALRARHALDDSLDVVAAHGVGGVVGALLTGVFAQST